MSNLSLTRKYLCPWCGAEKSLPTDLCTTVGCPGSIQSVSTTTVIDQNTSTTEG